MLRLKRRDLTRSVPKLYRMAVNELLGALFCVVVAFAKEIYAVLNTPVLPDDVCPVPLHGRYPKTCSAI